MGSCTLSWTDVCGELCGLSSVHASELCACIIHSTLYQRFQCLGPGISVLGEPKALSALSTVQFVSVCSGFSFSETQPPKSRSLRRMRGPVHLVVCLQQQVTRLQEKIKKTHDTLPEHSLWVMSILSQTCVFVSYVMQEKPEMTDNCCISQKGQEKSRSLELLANSSKTRKLH